VVVELYGFFPRSRAAARFDEHGKRGRARAKRRRREDARDLADARARVRDCRGLGVEIFRRIPRVEVRRALRPRVAAMIAMMGVLLYER
jgi:hypothetical protein